LEPALRIECPLLFLEDAGREKTVDRLQGLSGVHQHGSPALALPASSRMFNTDSSTEIGFHDCRLRLEEISRLDWPHSV
jgi:hypothetical protein